MTTQTKVKEPAIKRAKETSEIILLRKPLNLKRPRVSRRFPLRGKINYFYGVSLNKIYNLLRQNRKWKRPCLATVVTTYQ